MRRGFVHIVMLALGCFTVGCTDADQSTYGPALQTATSLQSKIMPTNALPASFDEQRTYWLLSTTTTPEVLLMQLIQAGMPLTQAWLPLDNLCMDPIGARFTIEVRDPDQRVFQFGFMPGSGRLACATAVRHFTFVQ